MDQIRPSDWSLQIFLQSDWRTQEHCASESKMLTRGEHRQFVGVTKCWREQEKKAVADRWRERKKLTRNVRDKQRMRVSPSTNIIGSSHDRFLTKKISATLLTSFIGSRPSNPACRLGSLHVWLWVGVGDWGESFKFANFQSRGPNLAFWSWSDRSNFPAIWLVTPLISNLCYSENS